LSWILGEHHGSYGDAFSHQAFDLYLVTRLDGSTVEDVIGLIARGAAPVREGRILLDQKDGLIDALGNGCLKAAADRLTSSAYGNRVVLETTSRVLSGQKNVPGYYSWGSHDWAITTRRFGFGFAPGAIAGGVPVARGGGLRGGWDAGGGGD